MANTSTYHRRPYNQRSTTYTIEFYKHRIQTVVTKDPDVVSTWIQQTEEIYIRHLNRLIVGLDVECKPCFIRGEHFKAATIQICIGSRCLIFQIIHSPVVPVSLVKFMNNPNYTFTGVGVYNDVVKLRNDYGLGNEARVMELGSLAEKVYGPTDSNQLGLKKLTNLVLDKVLEKPKHITLSWWHKFNLSYEQVEYACLDAFVSFEIARVLMAKTNC